MIATVTIQGVFRYDPHIFDGLHVPDGVDAADTIGAILRRCADLPIICADPDYLRDSIENWSDEKIASWTRMNTALSAVYNPIENYMADETETINDTENTYTNGTNTVKEQAFDTSRGMTDSGQTTGTSSLNRGNVKTRTFNRHGNIGVTTNQQMITAEMEMREQYNIYKIIADDFRAEFCLLVY